MHSVCEEMEQQAVTILETIRRSLTGISTPKTQKCKNEKKHTEQGYIQNEGDASYNKGNEAKKENSEASELHNR